ncbi:MAG: hypothetical protein COB27_003010 [Moritella sp.]|uniref:hypothetical protein n=1 Tax=Moritella sp. TaxID=78556 RepID=UPI00217425A4|nr:hypothetical protein [Moritella sp.]MBL1415836.1 hypothetical protein [Moritella sp.]
MTCQVEGVVFGPESKEAIKNIRDISRSAQILSVTLAVSILSDIFVKNGPVSASYKIYTTDFDLLGSAMSSSTPMLRNRVDHIAGEMVIFKSSKLTAAEKKFWRCVYNETS